MHIHETTTDHCCCPHLSFLKAQPPAGRTCIHGNDPQNCPDCNVR